MTAPYYRDEFVTLWHGDCLEHPEWWTPADVLITDPPYGIEWSPKVGGYRGAGSQQICGHIAGDEGVASRDAALTCWGDRPAMIFGSWRPPMPDGVRHRLIWHKRGMAPGPANAPFQTQDEEIYVLGDGWRSTSPPLRSVIATDEPRSVAVARAGHPTPKPVGLMTVLLSRAQPEWSIADPFAGSGSTLVAAKALGRRAVGVELEEKYCEIAARRLSQDVLDFSGGAA